MRSFSKTGLFHYLLIGETVLLFSLFSAWAITSLVKRDIPSDDFSFRPGFGPLFQNYRILQHFLHRPEEKRDDRGGKGADSSPVVEEIKLLRVCRDSIDAGRYDEALSILGAPMQTFPFLTESRTEMLLTCLYRTKKYREFVDRFEPGRPGGRELAVFRIHCLWQLGREAEALAAFRDSYSAFHLRFLRDLLPGTVWRVLTRRLDAAFWFDQYRDLAEKGGAAELAVASSLVNDPQLAILFRAESQFQSRRYSDALRSARRIRSSQYAPYGKKLLYQIELRTNPDFDFRKTLEEFRSFPSLYRGLVLESGNMLLVSEKYAEALECYLKFLTLGRDSEERYWKVVWQAAWLHYRLNQRNQALALFRKGSDAPFTAYRIPCQYWQARLGHRYDLELVENPFSYYATRLFHDRVFYAKLNQKYVQALNGPVSARVGSAIDQLRVLNQYGYYDECLQLIRWAKTTESMSEVDQNMLATIESILLYNQSRYQTAFRKFKENFESFQGIRLPNFLSHLYFPVQYQDIISIQCRTHGVDPQLVMALIREESFFRPDAVSHARAYGLMQILVQTARRHAGSRKISRRDLLSPETNIPIGIAYLKSLLDRYDGKAYLALAAYNAGETRVDRWIGMFPDAAEDEFIEMIPFSETRNYVKNVLLSQFFYKYYYDGAPADTNGDKQALRNVEPEPLS